MSIQKANLKTHKTAINYDKASSFSSLNMNRVTLAFFAVCGLDVLNSLDLLSEKRRREICDWIYRFQIVSNVDDDDNNTDGSSGDVSKSCSGFQGSSTLNILNSDPKTCGSEKYKWGHLAMTYTGISMLITLGDDLTRLNRKAIVEGVAAVQRDDGSFSASIEGNEHDMRFVYCAAAICNMLDDWGTVDKKLMAEYIKKSIVRLQTKQFFSNFTRILYACQMTFEILKFNYFPKFHFTRLQQRYDCGVSQHYDMESHGGTTFCAIAALHLSEQIDILPETTRDRLIRWLVFRQVTFFRFSIFCLIFQF